jgi:hypothetical protein
MNDMRPWVRPVGRFFSDMTLYFSYAGSFNGQHRNFAGAPGAPNLVSRGSEGKTGRLAHLVLSVNERHVGETDKAENVTQIGFLKIELLCGSSLLIGTPVRSDDNQFLVLKQSLWTLRAV